MGVTCSRCGRENEPGDSFCAFCGAFLGWEEGQPPETRQFTPQPAQPGDQSAAVQIQVKNDLIEVAPGNAESTAFTVKNLGTQVEEFRVLVTGPEWLAVEPATMTVYPGNEAMGTVQAAPPRTPRSVAGVTPFRLTVTSSLHAHVSSSASGRVNVGPFYELAAGLAPTSSFGRGVTRHRVTLDNRGNVPLRVALNPTDVASGLRLEVPPVVDVPPGGVVEVPVSVSGSRRWVGRPEPKVFTIVAEPPRPLAPTRMAGTRVVVPLFPAWVLVAAAGLAVAAVVGATVIPKLTAHNAANQTSASSTASAPPTSAPSPTQSTSAPPSPTPSPSSSASPSPSPSATPVITGVSFIGSTAATPTVIITGHGFGTEPAGILDTNTPCNTFNNNGNDYPLSILRFWDQTANFYAGGGIPPSGDCIGLIVQSWSAHQVVYNFGAAYNNIYGTYYITAGDQYTVWVNNLQYSGAVSFSA